MSIFSVFISTGRSPHVILYKRIWYVVSFPVKRVIRKLPPFRQLYGGYVRNNLWLLGVIREQNPAPREYNTPQELTLIHSSSSVQWVEHKATQQRLPSVTVFSFLLYIQCDSFFLSSSFSSKLTFHLRSHEEELVSCLEFSFVLRTGNLRVYKM